MRSQRIPKPIDLGLVLTLYDERDRLVELEVGATVEALEPRATDREVHGQDHARGAARGVGRGAPDLVDVAVGHEADVELSRLLSLAVEPQARIGLLHLVLLHQRVGRPPLVTVLDGRPPRDSSLGRKIES